MGSEGTSHVVIAICCPPSPKLPTPSPNRSQVSSVHTARLPQSTNRTVWSSRTDVGRAQGYNQGVTNVKAQLFPLRDPEYGCTADE